MNGQAESSQTPRVSVLDPVSQALEWTLEVLFRPFRLEKWLVLGFAAWLSMLADCNSGGSSNLNDGDRRTRLGDGAYEAWEWFLTHLLPVLVIVGVVMTIVFVIWIVLLWVSSRGKFVFLDGVVRNRAEIVAPWKTYGARGDSLFLFRAFLGAAALVVIFSILIASGAMVWILDLSHGGRPLIVLGLIVAGTTFLALVCFLLLLELALEDFVVPLMYAGEGGLFAAWRELFGLISFRPGAFLLYVGVRIVIGVVFFALIVFSCCMTCCLVVIPYVGTVILLPLWVFRRAYSIRFLAQFGPRYAAFGEVRPAAGEAPVQSC